MTDILKVQDLNDNEGIVMSTNLMGITNSRREVLYNFMSP